MDTIDNWLLDINKKEEEKSFFYKSPNTYIKYLQKMSLQKKNLFP